MTGTKKHRHLKMARSVRDTYAEYDEAVREHKPANVQCRKGCAGCCYQLLGITVAEGAAIYVRHQALVEERLDRLREDSKQMDEILLRNGIDPHKAPDPHELPIMIGPAKDILCDAWWELWKPCPFLDEKANTCRIYDVRPASCRSYFVTSDPARCVSESGNKVDVWTFGQEWLAMRIALGNGGRHVSVGPIADVLLHVRKEFRG